MSTTVLETRSLVKKFGGITATNDVSLKVEKGARHALIGPNGAGKTTLINLLTGVLEPSSGSIALDGQDITRLAPHRRVGLGIVRTFQINQLFAGLTPLESMVTAIAERERGGAVWWRRTGTGADAALADEAATLLVEFGNADAQNLSLDRRAEAQIGVADRLVDGRHHALVPHLNGKRARLRHADRRNLVQRRALSVGLDLNRLQ